MPAREAGDEDLVLPVHAPEETERTEDESVTSLVTDEIDQRVALVTSLLQEAQRAVRQVRFVDEAAVYEDMVITHVEATRTQREYGAAFQVSLEQIQFAFTATVDTPLPAEPRGAPFKAAGGVAAKAVASETVDEKQRSDAVRIAESIGNWVGLRF